MTVKDDMRAVLDAVGWTGDAELDATPRQFTEMLAEFAPGQPLPRFEPLATESRDPVLLRSIPFYSLCAHHLLPFFGEATIAYRPNGKIVGLGSIPRLVEVVARQPQLQERLAAQTADALLAATEATSVIVHLRCRQLCVEMRGARSCADHEVLAERGQADPGLRLLVLGAETPA